MQQRLFVHIVPFYVGNWDFYTSLPVCVYLWVLGKYCLLLWPLPEADGLWYQHTWKDEVKIINNIVRHSFSKLIKVSEHTFVFLNHTDLSFCNNDSWLTTSSINSAFLSLLTKDTLQSQNTVTLFAKIHSLLYQKKQSFILTKEWSFTMAF